ncbi:MAG TPA: hypothetical protein PLH97_16490, partial [Verrucomicrobiota bacterium]|nr:hypothetical protein [Verrucomicrobiota bacterium]
MRRPSCGPERLRLLLLLAVALVSPGGLARAAEPVTLHLKSGDRISGIILSETESSLVLSNVWSEALTVPVNQIAKRGDGLRG